MQLSEESLRGMERHFVGTLRVPPRRRIAPAAGPRLLWSGAGTGAARARGGDCAVDFGTAESPGTERREVAVATLGAEPLTLEIVATPPWLEADWGEGRLRAHLRCGGPAAVLALVARHDVLTATTFEDGVQLLARTMAGEEETAEIAVRLVARRDLPRGQYDFDGAMLPYPYNFGVISSTGEGVTPCVFSFASIAPPPLVVTFSDLPDWLIFKVDGHERQGPVSGPFFQRTAPFAVEIRPRWPGPAPERTELRTDMVHLTTNDGRPAFQQLELEFSGEFAAPPLRRWWSPRRPHPVS